MAGPPRFLHNVSITFKVSLLHISLFFSAQSACCTHPQGRVTNTLKCCTLNSLSAFVVELFTRLSLIPKWDIHHFKKCCTPPMQNECWPGSETQCGLSLNVLEKSRPLLMKGVCTAHNHCLLTCFRCNEGSPCILLIMFLPQGNSLPSGWTTWSFNLCSLLVWSLSCTEWKILLSKSYITRSHCKFIYVHKKKRHTYVCADDTIQVMEK